MASFELAFEALTPAPAAARNLRRSIMTAIVFESGSECDILRIDAGGMSMDKSRIITLAVVCTIVLGVTALAQTTTGSIVGIVTDPGGASVPGATVTVTNEGTGVVAIKMTT